MIYLLHGDYSTGIAWAKEHGIVFDAIVTDPPYSGGNGAGTTAKRYTRLKGKCPFPDFDEPDAKDWSTFMEQVFLIAGGCCAKDASCYAFIDWRRVGDMQEAMRRGGWKVRGVAVWDKTLSGVFPQKGMMRQRAEFIVWSERGKPRAGSHQFFDGIFTHRRVTGKGRYHQTQKPLGLMRDLIATLPERARWVFDPFAGSGSTLIAAAERGLDALGCESSAACFDAACKRMMDEDQAFIALDDARDADKGERRNE